MTTPTQTPDDKAAIEALAEAMWELEQLALVRGGSLELSGEYASYALQAIRANPDILRSMGIGRLPTRSELRDLKDDTYVLAKWQVDHIVAAGFAVEDPAPDETEIDDIKAEIATWTPERRRAALVALTAAAEAGRS